VVVAPQYNLTIQSEAEGPEEAFMEGMHTADPEQAKAIKGKEPEEPEDRHTQPMEMVEAVAGLRERQEQTLGVVEATEPQGKTVTKTDPENRAEVARSQETQIYQPP
jgi:hypothetical protein